MSRIKLQDVAYAAYQVPDLDVIERFLTDFGMLRSARTEDALYMRGMGSSHHIHVSRLGPDSRFLGAGWIVPDLAQLEFAATIPGATPIEEITEPGGGQRVTLTTPNGHKIWLEHGAAKVPELPARRSYRLNTFSDHMRLNSPVRQRAEPTPVLRFGHFVLWVADADAELQWFAKYFELIPSDYICGADENDVVGTFLRYDRGDDYVEHHCILINKSKNFGCHHTSYEVLDLDAVVAGHEYLVTNGWTLDAGYGRHYLGSLIYDYWLDPFGNRIEHYTDTDLVNDGYVPVRFVGDASETTQWGMAPPPTFFD